jgi:hypothetical protein
MIKAMVVPELEHQHAHRHRVSVVSVQLQGFRCCQSRSVQVTAHPHTHILRAPKPPAPSKRPVELSVANIPFFQTAAPVSVGHVGFDDGCGCAQQPMLQPQDYFSLRGVVGPSILPAKANQAISRFLRDSYGPAPAWNCVLLLFIYHCKVSFCARFSCSPRCPQWASSCTISLLNN